MTFLSQKQTALEDEILSLRNKMELAIRQEKSLTSELVIQLSSLLDQKINEYMINKKNKNNIEKL